tara:strand:+ start:44 stop:283 length:240 start_codon:yes stop_codon:yes gene_type:complete
MITENYYKKLADIVSEVVGHKNFELKADMKATDVEGWDSLSHVQIIHECEKSLGVRFSLEEISNLNTVGDLINLMDKNS